MDCLRRCFPGRRNCYYFWLSTYFVALAVYTVAIKLWAQEWSAYRSAHGMDLNIIPILIRGIAVALCMAVGLLNVGHCCHVYNSERWFDRVRVSGSLAGLVLMAIETLTSIVWKMDRDEKSTEAVSLWNVIIMQYVSCILAFISGYLVSYNFEFPVLDYRTSLRLAVRRLSRRRRRNNDDDDGNNAGGNGGDGNGDEGVESIELIDQQFDVGINRLDDNEFEQESHELFSWQDGICNHAESQRHVVFEEGNGCTDVPTTWTEDGLVFELNHKCKIDVSEDSDVVRGQSIKYVSRRVRYDEENNDTCLANYVSRGSGGERGNCDVSHASDVSRTTPTRRGYSDAHRAYYVNQGTHPHFADCVIQVTGGESGDNDAHIANDISQGRDYAEDELVSYQVELCMEPAPQEQAPYGAEFDTKLKEVRPIPSPDKNQQTANKRNQKRSPPRSNSREPFDIRPLEKRGMDNCPSEGDTFVRRRRVRHPAGHETRKMGGKDGDACKPSTSGMDKKHGAEKSVASEATGNSETTGNSSPKERHFSDIFARSSKVSERKIPVPESSSVFCNSVAGPSRRGQDQSAVKHKGI